MPDLNKFISEFKHGFQQSNRFYVQIFVQPKMVLNIIGNAGLLGIVDAALSVGNVVKWLATGFLASSARIPDRGFGQVDLSMYGITEHFPVHTEYSTLDVTFMMPHTTNILNDNGVPRFFNYWQNQIQNNIAGPDSGFDFRFPSDYYATVLLTLMDKKDRGTITYKFDNVYPATVESSPLGWEKENEFSMLPVSFNYSYWKVLPHIESVAVSTIDKIINSLI